MKKYVKEELKINKKGFTLVELLVVIVILAVIMVITIPTVLGSMNKAKQSAFNTIGETMIKYLESNYQNCKIGNKEIAKFDEDLFDINNNCELQSGNLSEKLIVNSGYSTDDIETVEINNLGDGKFSVMLSPKSSGKFSSVNTFAYNPYKGECWTIEPVEGDNFKFVEFHGINKDTGDIVEECKSYVSKSGETYSIRIPSTYLDKQITTLGNTLFQGINLKYVNDEDVSEVTIYNKINNVVIEEGITTIEDGGYFNTGENSGYSLGSFLGIGNGNLTLQLPSTITYIGSGAFYITGLTSLELPSGLKIIGENAFGMNNISSLKIPSSVEIIGSLAFDFNENLESLEFFGADDNTSNLKIIGERAFYSNNLSSLIIPSSVETIEAEAFSYNGIKNLIFLGAEEYTSNLKIVGDYAFSDCNLDYQNESLYLQIPNDITSMGNGVFENNSNLRYIRFTGDYTGFGEYWNGSAVILPRRGPV